VPNPHAWQKCHGGQIVNTTLELTPQTNRLSILTVRSQVCGFAPDRCSFFRALRILMHSAKHTDINYYAEPVVAKYSGLRHFWHCVVVSSFQRTHALRVKAVFHARLIFVLFQICRRRLCLRYCVLTPSRFTCAFKVNPIRWSAYGNADFEKNVVMCLPFMRLSAIRK